MATATPALEKALKQFEGIQDSGTKMTAAGVTRKVFGLLAVAVAVGAVTYETLPLTNATYTGLLIAALAAFVMPFIAWRKTEWMPMIAVAYAVLEGGILGVISSAYNDQYSDSYGPNIAGVAIMLTALVAGTILVMFRAGYLRLSKRAMATIIAATGGIAAFYLIALLVNLFGGTMPLISSNSGWGIAFSLLATGLAASNLVVDFIFIESQIDEGLPESAEWAASFGVLISLLWLYLEMLRLLGKLTKR